jgi:type IV secretion system protein VirB10
MSALPHSEPERAPPKTVMPPLDVRAPRPPVVRLRRSVVTVAVMGAVGLLAGSLAWAFVVQPELRAEARAQKLERQSDVRGAVRASEVITDQPATYGQLPAPRTLGGGAGASSAEADTPDGDGPGHADPASAATPRVTASRGPVRSPTSEARQSGLFFSRSAPGPARPGPGEDPDARDYAAVYNTHALLAPLSPFEIKAGAVLPALLLTGVDTARAGPVVATVTGNIYDTVSGRHLLIPQGSRLIGRHEGESRHGDKRAYVAWDRLVLPNGRSLILTKEPGVDAQGVIGAEGRVDRRLLPLAVATLFAGAITTLGQVARDRDDDSGGLLGDAGDAASIEAAQVGGKLIDRELEVRPSIRLRPGARVQVLITRDLILEPYRS